MDLPTALSLGLEVRRGWDERHLAERMNPAMVRRIASPRIGTPLPLSCKSSMWSRAPALQSSSMPNSPRPTSSVGCTWCGCGSRSTATFSGTD